MPVVTPGPQAIRGRKQKGAPPKRCTSLEQCASTTTQRYPGEVSHTRKIKSRPGISRAAGVGEKRKGAPKQGCAGTASDAPRMVV